MSPKQDAYDVVTSKIVAALEQGVVPWHRPWRSASGQEPTSMSTGKAYRGVNYWLLSLTATAEGYSSPFWGTYRQIEERGGQVRKGEKGTQIVLWKKASRKVENDAGEREERSYAFLRYFTVFNADQADGLGDEFAAPEVEVSEIERLQYADEIAHGYTSVEVKHGGNRAYYSPALDYVQMPETHQFDSSEGYYATLFHELAHSTGHESRLARPSLLSPTPFGTPDYSREELVAEMAAAFLCGEAGIPVNVPQSAAYIASWLKVLENDRKLVIQAAKDAQRASDLILGIDEGAAPAAPSPVASSAA
jgi:antirestriction protein ArdC